MAKELMNPIQVQQSLGGIHYPAKKEDLITHARNNEAPDEVMRTLEALPDKFYISPADITHEIGQLGDGE